MGSAPPAPSAINNLFFPTIDIVTNNSSPSSLTLRCNHGFYSHFSLFLLRSNYFPLAGSGSGSSRRHGTTSTSTSLAIAFRAHNHSDSNIDNDDGTVAAVSNAAAAAAAEEEENDDDGGGGGGGMVVSPDYKAIISACLVGLFTGFAVVLFNVAVDEIRDIFWDGIPDRGASWLREEPIQIKWGRVILVPACGGLLVTLLNLFRNALEGPSNWVLLNNVKGTLRPIFKALAACVTLGTANSLGPEGPSVDIGTSVAQGVGTLFNNDTYRNLSLKAAGSAAGISSGFNAAVAGCFFAVESVLWPAPAVSSLTNITSMVILSSVIASVVSEIGLGSEPAFTVPNYDFRSPSELPLYLLLGTVCGLVSVSLSRCTTFMLVTVDSVEKVSGFPKSTFPILGGLVVGVIALAYPEILYWGFENVDILLESRPLVESISINLLLQLVAVKIFATSLCRASGLVGGYYAPSLFIGAATGMAYGKVLSFVISQPNSIVHLPFLDVASPQAYGLVGMAATLAGVCQVPLTAVLLLFELTQDYRIVLPLLGAVGVSTLITSGLTRKQGVEETKGTNDRVASISQQPEISSSSSLLISDRKILNNEVDLNKIVSFPDLDEPDKDTNDIAERICVEQAMRTSFVTVLKSTPITEALSLMLAEKQPCAVIVDDKNILIGLITLANIQQFTERSNMKNKSSEEFLVSDVCLPEGEECEIPLAVTPNMNLLSAQDLMNKHGVSEVPVVLEHVQGHLYPVGLLDSGCISLTCRGVAIRKCIQGFTTIEIQKN